MPVQAIRPAGFIVPKRSVLQAELERFARKTTDEVKRYPPWRPWSSTPPRTGRRAGGRRTGDLGRSWQYKVSLGGDSGYVEVASDEGRLERPYARYVQGKRQTSVMSGRGWKTIDEVAERRRAEFAERCREWAVVLVKKA